MTVKFKVKFPELYFQFFKQFLQVSNDLYSIGIFSIFCGPTLIFLKVE